MSWWSEVILTASSLENLGPEDGPERYLGIEHLNKWLSEHRYGSLFLIAPADSQVHNINACFAGSFKNLNREAFLEEVNRAPWVWRSMVQIFIRGEDDKGFQEIKLK